MPRHVVRTSLREAPRFCLRGRELWCRYGRRRICTEESCFNRPKGPIQSTTYVLCGTYCGGDQHNQRNQSFLRAKRFGECQFRARFPPARGRIRIENLYLESIPVWNLVENFSSDLLSTKSVAHIYATNII